MSSQRFYLFNSVDFLYISRRLCVSSIDKVLSECNCHHNGSRTTADCRSADIRLSAVPDPARRLSDPGTHRAGPSTADNHRSCCCPAVIGSGTGGMVRTSSGRAVSAADVAAADSRPSTGCCSCSVERRCCIAADCCRRTSTGPVAAADYRILGSDENLGCLERRCGLRNGSKKKKTLINSIRRGNLQAPPLPRLGTQLEQFKLHN